MCVNSDLLAAALTARVAAGCAIHGAAAVAAIADRLAAYSALEAVARCIISGAAMPCAAAEPPDPRGVWPGVQIHALAAGIAPLALALTTAETACATAKLTVLVQPILRSAGSLLSAHRALLAGDTAQLRLLLAARAPLGTVPRSTRLPRALEDAWNEASVSHDRDTRVLNFESSALSVSRGPLASLLSSPPPITTNDERDSLRNLLVAALDSSNTRPCLDALGFSFRLLGRAVVSAFDAASPVLVCAAARDVYGALTVLSQNGAIDAVVAARTAAVHVDVEQQARAQSVGALALINGVDGALRVAAAGAALAEALVFDPSESALAAADRAAAAVELSRTLGLSVGSTAIFDYSVTSITTTMITTLGKAMATAIGIAALRAARAAARQRDVSAVLAHALQSTDFYVHLARDEIEWVATEAELRGAHLALVSALRYGEPLRGVLLEAGAALERAGPAREERGCVASRRMLNLFPVAASFFALREARAAAIVENGDYEAMDYAEVEAEAAATTAADALRGLEAREAGMDVDLLVLLDAEARAPPTTHAPGAMEAARIAAAHAALCRALRGDCVYMLHEAVAKAQAARVFHADPDFLVASLVLTASSNAAKDILAALANDDCDAARGALTALQALSHAPTEAAVDDENSQKYHQYRLPIGTLAALSTLACADEMAFCRRRLSRALVRGATEHELVAETLALKREYCIALATCGGDTNAGIPCVGSLVIGGEGGVADATRAVFSLAACPVLRPWTEFAAASEACGAKACFSTPEEPCSQSETDCGATPWLASLRGASVRAPRVALTSRAAREVLSHASQTLHEGVAAFCAGGPGVGGGSWALVSIEEGGPSLSLVLSAQSALSVAAQHAPALDDELFFAALRAATAGAPAWSRALALITAAADSGATPSFDAENAIEWFIRVGPDPSNLLARVIKPLGAQEDAALRALHGAALRLAMGGEGVYRGAPGAYSLRDSLRGTFRSPNLT